MSGSIADVSVRLQWLIYVYGFAKVFNSSVQATGSLSSSEIFIRAERGGECLDVASSSSDATDAIGAFLAHGNVHDIWNRCCTWWGPSRDNNSASVHEYFRQLTAVLIGEDTARPAKDPIDLILKSGGMRQSLRRCESILESHTPLLYDIRFCIFFSIHLWSSPHIPVTHTLSYAQLKPESLNLSLTLEVKNPSTSSPERLSLRTKTESMGGQSHILILGGRGRGLDMRLEIVL